MTLPLLFILILLLSLGLLLYLLKPSKVETAVKRQLASLQTEHRPLAADTILREAKPHAVPWLEALVSQIPGAQALTKLIQQAGKNWPITSLAFGSLALLLSGWLLASLIMPLPLLSIAIGGLIGAIPIAYLYVVRDLRFGRFDGQLPEAVDLMSRALRAGHSVASALEMVGNESPDPLGAEFRILHEEQRLGLPTRDAVLSLVKRFPRGQMGFLATAILVQAETGGNLAQILDKAANVMRERQRLLGQVRIYTAQGRVTGWILCGLPFLMFLLISSVNPTYERALITDPTGRELIYAGLVMMTVGIVAVRQIIKIKI